MKHFSFTRLLPCLLIAVCPPLLGHCGGAVEHGTETGNPPVVEQQKLHIVLGDRGVQVVGDAGAVSPGASVRVTNRTTGAHVEATARADGSINVVVPGSLQDEYEVTVSNGAGTQTVQVTAQTSGVDGASGAAGEGGSADTGSSAGAAGTAMIGPPGPDPLVCRSLQQALSARVTAGFASVGKTCQRDEECVFTNINAGCFSSCEGAIASLSGADAARATIAQDIEPLCNELSNQQCEVERPACADVLTFMSCNHEVCDKLGNLSCDDLPTRGAARARNAVNDASRACSRDSDCALAQADIRCAASCNNLYYGVAASALEEMLGRVAQAEGLYCGIAESNGCPAPLALPCLPPTETPQATCTAGQCEVTYVPLP
jgi:hypothetical protein